MSVWSPVGDTPLVRLDPGRATVGFYGSLDLRTRRELVTRRHDLMATARAAHLQRHLHTFPTDPILRFWERVPWHPGRAIRAVLSANPRWELIEFPVAAPT